MSLKEWHQAAGTETKAVLVMQEPEEVMGTQRGAWWVLSGSDIVTFHGCCTFGAMCHPVRMTDSLIM